MNVSVATTSPLKSFHPVRFVSLSRFLEGSTNGPSVWLHQVVHSENPQTSKHWNSMIPDKCESLSLSLDSLLKWWMGFLSNASPASTSFIIRTVRRYVPGHTTWNNSLAKFAEKVDSEVQGRQKAHHFEVCFIFRLGWRAEIHRVDLHWLEQIEFSTSRKKTKAFQQWLGFLRHYFIPFSPHIFYHGWFKGKQTGLAFSRSTQRKKRGRPLW